MWEACAGLSRLWCMVHGQTAYQMVFVRMCGSGHVGSLAMLFFVQIVADS